MSAITNQDEAHMTTPELIAHHGYTSETHHTWTEDGYCLTIHRIVASKRSQTYSTNCNVISNRVETVINDLEGDIKLNVSESLKNLQESKSICSENNPLSRPPVIIHHGILSSSADWVLLGPQKALAYTLFEAGFDVWLANARGNAYSQQHKVYTVKDKEFWDFSWHEIGYYDLPAIIDYVLEKTGYSEVYYIGYSQGTTIFFVMASERPEYNAKVKVMVNLAPIAFLSNQRSPLLKCVVHFDSVIEFGFSYCHIHQWFPRNKLQARAFGTLLRNAPNALIRGVCNCWFHLIAGFGSNQLDRSLLPLIFGHFPAGASAKQMIHYSQSILSGLFRKFDYGVTENFKRYGSTQPPKYNLEKIKVPVAIFYGENDFLTHPLDLQKLVDKLPNVIEIKKIDYPKFNHIDFLWGRDAKVLLYNCIVAVLKRFRHL